MNLFTLLVFLACALPSSYWFLLAIASIRKPVVPKVGNSQTKHRFALMIPAHNEESVIAATVKQLLNQQYPADLFDIFVVADYCSDNTATIARSCGAIVHERKEGERSGKGGALSWLFEKVLDEHQYDAAVIFDSDTQVDAAFLEVMDAQLSHGDLVVQGQHVISNPDQGWFPALVWALFLIDNRFQNLGRNNLGFSAKHMGDSICFKVGVLEHLGWGQGLTDDFQMRQKLLLEGIKIKYQPEAIGYGEAPLTWKQAKAQRERWLRGARDVSQQLGRRLITEGLKRRDGALLDGAFQCFLPSYSTLTLLCIFALVAQLLINWAFGPMTSPAMLWAWAVLAMLLFLYPFFGLVLERAPLRAYLVVISGPVFILWRTWLAFQVRVRKKMIVWIRTEHGQAKTN